VTSQTVGGREQSDLTHNTANTIVGREQSNLTNNTADHCRKEV